MKSGRSLRGLRALWKKSAKRPSLNAELLEDAELSPFAARYKLAVEGIRDPNEARRLLDLEGSPVRRTG